MLGAEHPDTLESMGNLARIHSSQGKLSETLQIEVQVLEMRKRVLGSEHLDTLRSMGNLARTYADIGNLKEAEQL